MIVHRVRPVAFVAAVCWATACSAGSIANQRSLGAGQSSSYYDVTTSTVHALHLRADTGDRRSSWMEAEAAKGPLLYVSSDMLDGVDIYSYPQGKLVGQILGLKYPPQGLCSDAKGDVFVPQEIFSDILEFAHGGTSPIATLQDPNEGPTSCSVNRSSGDLAVANITNSGQTAGDIVVYEKATGAPLAFTIPNMTLYYECGYDNKGDLFADGYDGFPSGGATFQFAELAANKKAFKLVTIDRSISVPGVVQWDGAYMAIGDASNGVIYRTDGATGKVQSTVTLTGAAYDFQPIIQGSTIVAPSFYGIDTGFWKYPAGGDSFKKVKVGSAFGATISVAAKGNE